MGCSRPSQQRPWSAVLSAMLLGLITPLLLLGIWAETGQASGSSSVNAVPFRASPRGEAELRSRIDRYWAAASDTGNGTLTRRDLTYQQAYGKGIMLQCLLDTTNLNDVQAYLTAQGKGAQATSPWLDFFSLDYNGWVLSTNGPGFDEDDFEPIFGVDASQNRYQIWWQSALVIYQGRRYEPTGGRYGNLFNPSGGLIAADENYSPASQAPPTQARSDIVPLQQWSDVVFLAWQQLCVSTGAPVYGLTKVFRVAVANTETKAIIETAVPSVGGSLTNEWDDRVRFVAGTPGFYALLGTPNGSGVAWLLLQHRQQMTHLTIVAVSYFQEPDTDSYCLYFEIGPFSAAAEPP